MVQPKGNNLVIPKTVKHRIMLYIICICLKLCYYISYIYKTQPHNSTLRHIPKGTENRDSNKYLDANVHCSILHNSQ